MKSAIFLALFVSSGLFLQSCKKSPEVGADPPPAGVRAEYVPTPVVSRNPAYLVGANACPLWTYEKRPSVWESIFPFRSRQPVLGWYEEANAELIDWEINYALEHGISFFNICWYRALSNEGRAPILEEFGHWTREIKKSRFRDLFGYALIFVEQDQMGGVAGWEDWTKNLVPYWINEHFKRSYYLKIKNSPVFTIYDIDRFVGSFSSRQQAREAIQFFKEACIANGLGPVIVFGSYSLNVNANVKSKFADLGLDYVMAYHWPSFSGLMGAIPPANQTIMNHQETAWTGLETSTGLTSVPTVSIGWDSAPWGNLYYPGSWRLSPSEFENLLLRAKQFTDRRNIRDAEIGKIILLDNWNEYGEGHYLMPTRSTGFEDLDAVWRVFGDKSKAPSNILPETIGLGPY